MAAFAAGLHEMYAECISRPATALDVAFSPAARNSAVLFITAGGKHPDILGAFTRVARMEPKHLAVLCGSRVSPLADVVARFSGASYLPFTFPAGKDGFLATNSALASALLLLRGFWAAHSLNLKLPKYEALDPQGMDRWIEAARELTLNLWNRPNILVLHGPAGTAAALDLESRFHESGMAAVQLADFRNFAHGRHFWLARMKQSTLVLALAAPDEDDLASRTLALFPDDIKRAQITANAPGPLASIELLLLSIHMAGWSGTAQGIDPGRPTVPEFGRRIYHLNAWATHNNKKEQWEPAVWRKSKRSRAVLQSADESTEWTNAHSEFVNDLASSRFAAVVLDYDDTVCAPTERYTRPSRAMADELNRLLGGGLWVGIATGRGKSVRKALCTIVKPAFWTRVVVGYYNGAQVAALSDASAPAVSKRQIGGVLGQFLSLLVADRHLAALVKAESNAVQVKIEPVEAAGISDVARWIQHLVATSQLPLRVVVSSRSIDVILPTTSKNAVIKALRHSCGQAAEVLCIGDSGEWPGNDFELLANRHSLSSDTTSPDPSTCWNLAPVGTRYTEATLGYIKALHVCDGTAHFRPGALEKL